MPDFLLHEAESLRYQGGDYPRNYPKNLKNKVARPAGLRTETHDPFLLSERWILVEIVAVYLVARKEGKSSLDP